ncbi:hypothetical protein D3C77_194390 [compost metagenome]
MHRRYGVWHVGITGHDDDRQRRFVRFANLPDQLQAIERPHTQIGNQQTDILLTFQALQGLFGIFRHHALDTLGFQVTGQRFASQLIVIDDQYFLWHSPRRRNRCQCFTFGITQYVFLVGHGCLIINDSQNVPRIKFRPLLIALQPASRRQFDTRRVSHPARRPI